MVRPRKDSDRPDCPTGGDDHDESRITDGCGPSESSQTSEVIVRSSGGLTEQLRDVLRGDGDGDLSHGRGDVENGVLQWLRALESQVIGACRACERLRPLPELSISSGVVEDGLMTHLTQHFKVSEVGMITRCLCIPLVSIRVGKISKQGNLLCPKPTRGHLNLTLLPSSNMCITFSGDDGCNEILATVCNDSKNSDVTIEEIASDSSGRSFLVKVPECRVLYFWCSEKSKLQGMELLSKMKDLLRRRPSLSGLTGIAGSRLDSFATHLQAYLLGSANNAEAADATASSSILLRATSSSHESNPDCQSSSTLLKSLHFHLTAGQASKVHTFYKGSLSPRPNTFRERLAGSSASSRNEMREKLRQRGDNHSNMLANSHLSTLESTSSTIYVPSSNQFEDEKLPGGRVDPGRAHSVLPDLLCLPSPFSSLISPSSLPLSKVTDLNPKFSPYYCLCPPCPWKSSPQSMIAPHTPSILSESLPLPPLSTLLSAVASPGSLSSNLTSDVAQLPTLDLPTFIPDSLVHLPFPVSSLVTMPSSQQIPTFTPLMSDPIVHIPVIDVCSSGQGYVVNAGPAISSAVPPLLPTVGKPLIPETESVVEKSARETLRMLMASTPMPASSGLMNVLPAVLGSVNERIALINGNKCGGILASRNFYVGSQDVDAVASSLASIGFSCSSGSTSECRSSTTSKLNCKAQEDPEGSSCAEDNCSPD